MELYDALNEYYSNYDEDGRLLSQHGKVEFLTTVKYIGKYLKPGMKLLEIGAATGRYSHYFARQGYDVTAVELIPHNIEIFNQNTQPGENIRIYQGNALQLDMLVDEQFDLVLLLGPMYHLYSLSEKRQALSEALRVLKKGGVICIAYCMVDSSIIQYAFGYNIWKDLVEKELLNPDGFTARSNPEQLFEIVRKEEIDAINEGFPLQRLHLIGTDMYTNYFREMIDGMDEDSFQFYLKYHFCICERADMVGLSNHTLDILRKNAAQS